MEKWNREFWYGPDGVYEADIRRNEQGNIVEVRYITETKRPRVASPTISVYAGMFFPQNSKYGSSGKLVLHRRPDNVKFAGDWELLGGGISAKAFSHANDERVIRKELAKIISEKVNFSLEIELDHMPQMYPAVIKGGSDCAFVVSAWTNEMGLSIFSEDNFKLVSPQELLELANGPEGNRLLSGYGKRMHRLALKAFQFPHCSSDDYKKEAEKMLQEIYDQ
jgi:hypothetical protein